jgi:geranylgeranyl reductase family protein
MLAASALSKGFSSFQPQELVDEIVNKAGGTKPAILYGAVGATAVITSLATFYNVSLNPQRRKTFADYEPITEAYYDVAIVGSGPSGSTLAWYLKKENPSLKVLLLDKAKFPREKFCGDAVTQIAQKHIRRMGVLQEIEEQKLGHYSKSGGFVSPCGNSFIGDSAKQLGLSGGPVIAIKRIVMDEKMAMAAKNAGALLTEQTTVEQAYFLKEKGVWKVDCTFTGEAEPKPITYLARCLVCADGAPSSLARKLGYVKEEPQGTCSRAYVKGNTQFKFDGVVFYPPKLLPGYCAIIREANDELNFCTYIIPGGPAKNDDLASLHNEIMTQYPYVAASLGPNPDIERMKSASLRLGGISKSFDDHLLIIGDAAGFIDPLTGEGIQYAMESGEIASKVLLEGFKKGDLSAAQLKKYQNLWYSDWGIEFYLSMKMSLLLYRFPIMLDAAAKLIEKRGARFLGEWAEVMTGSRPKTWFLRLDVWPYICFEIFAQFVRNITGTK